MTNPIQALFSRFTNRWDSAGGYREVLKIAIPLILSTGSWSLQHFVDRMFLTWYSPEAIAASLPAGLLNWTLISFFVGVAAYANTFVAQYFGAKQEKRIGPAVWQALYFSVISAALVIPFYFSAGAVFEFAGHSSEVIELEIVYFQILLLATPFIVAANAATSFFSGLGRTWIIMWVNIFTTFINLVFDYLLIFGNFGFPELGIVGAGWASVLAMIFSATVFLWLFLRTPDHGRFDTRNFRFDPDLFRRLLKFGIPNGLQFVQAVFAFTLFIFLVGRLGINELAATNITFNINTLSFMPMMGMSIAVATLVGQRLGEDNPALARRTTYSTFQLAFIYFTTLSCFYFLLPEVFIWPFELEADPVEFAPIREMVINMLKFVALFGLFDSGNVIFSGAIKGAGDTRYVAIATLVLSVLLLLIPSWLAATVFEAGIYWLWTAVTAYIAGLCIAFWMRFRIGHWEKMRVIEEAS